ncbi:DMT family transporter [Pseudorhodoplanes sp.]|uniref:DMT family transporter n=1 Tax=Pseudorhodoplanes sp. TaxID=1934341 RepID=UPI0039188340
MNRFRRRIERVDHGIGLLRIRAGIPLCEQTKRHSEKSSRSTGQVRTFILEAAVLAHPSPALALKPGGIRRAAGAWFGRIRQPTSGPARMNNPTGQIDRTDAALLVFLSILWGVGFVFAGLALRELPPVSVVFGRVAFGALFLLPLILVFRTALPRGLRGWMPFFVMGLLNNVIPFALVAAGQALTTSGLASIVNATTPLFTLIVTAAFGEEKLTTHKVAGVLMGLAGVVILRGTGAEFASAQSVGILLCLGAALSYGFSALWGRRRLQGVPPLTSAFYQVLCSSAVLFVLMIAIDRPWTLAMPSAGTWLSLVGLGIFATSIAYLVFYRILARSGATNVMLVTLLMPVSTIVLAHFVLDEMLGLREAAGAVVIGAALLVIDGRVFGWIARLAKAST